MKKKLRILIVDRNRHVRDFVRRELSSGCHDVVLVGNTHDMLQQIELYSPFDLVILDPNLPELETPVGFQKVMSRIGTIPVVLHTLQTGMDRAELKGACLSLIEKKGNSIERIKQVVADIQTGSSVPGTMKDTLLMMLI